MDVLSCSYDLRFSIFPFSCGSPRSQPGYFRSHVFLDFGSQILSGSILFSLLFTTFPTVSCCLVCIFFFLLLSLLFTPLPLFVSCTTAWYLHWQDRNLAGLRKEAYRVCFPLLASVGLLSDLGVWTVSYIFHCKSWANLLFFFYIMCSVCSSNFCVHAVIQLSACLLSLLSYPGPLYMANGRSWTRIREQIQDTGLLYRYKKHTHKL